MSEGVPEPGAFSIRKDLRLNMAARTYTNLVAAVVESNAADRVLADLQGTFDIRLMAWVTAAGVTGQLKAQYTVNGSTWADLTTALSLTPTGLKASTWQPVPVGAKAICALRLVAFGGNTVEDPAIAAGAIAEFR